MKTKTEKKAHPIVVNMIKRGKIKLVSCSLLEMTHFFSKAKASVKLLFYGLNVKYKRVKS